MNPDNFNLTLAIYEVMQDGRERTLDDVANLIADRTDWSRNAVRGAFLRKDVRAFLSVTDVCRTRVYRIKRKETV